MLYWRAAVRRRPTPPIVHYDSGNIAPESLNLPSSCVLSVVVPAYNETERLPAMLDETTSFLEQRSTRYEIIVMDDGSKDKTSEVALNYAHKHQEQSKNGEIRVMRLTENRGKGCAVSQV